MNSVDLRKIAIIRYEFYENLREAKNRLHLHLFCLIEIPLDLLPFFTYLKLKLYEILQEVP